MHERKKIKKSRMFKFNYITLGFVDSWTPLSVES